MRGFAEFAGDEVLVVEIIIWQVDSIMGLGLLPRAVFRFLRNLFFGTARAGFADTNLRVAKRAGVLESFQR